MPQVLERVSEGVSEQVLERASEREANSQTPNRIRISRKMCEALADNDLLTGRYELIDGEIISKMGQKPVHSTFLGVIADFLSDIFGSRYVRSQLPIELEGTDRESNEPEPDIAVTQKTRLSFVVRHPLPHEVLLLVEVAGTSLAFDLKVKSLLYAKAGIADYWVADVNGRRLIVHRKPSPDGYLEIAAYSEEESLSPLARPDAMILVSDLMPPETAPE